MDLKEERILGGKIDHHWYYVAKGQAIRQFIGDLKVSEVLDVGAGSGIFSRQLLDGGFCDRAVCVDPNYAEERTEIYNGKQILFVRAKKTAPQTLILMMDVLEHVADDVAMLREHAESMDGKARILITVPAFQFLWSGHDVFLEHYRRYTIGLIEEVVRKAGLTPVKSRYFFASLFPAIAAIRLYKKALLSCGGLKAESELKMYPDWLNKALIVVHDMECRTLFCLNRSFGLSVFCLCRKG